MDVLEACDAVGPVCETRFVVCIDHLVEVYGRPVLLVLRLQTFELVLKELGGCMLGSIRAIAYVLHLILQIKVFSARWGYYERMKRSVLLTVVQVCSRLQLLNLRIFIFVFLNLRSTILLVPNIFRILIGRSVVGCKHTTFYIFVVLLDFANLKMILLLRFVHTKGHGAARFASGSEHFGRT